MPRGRVNREWQQEGPPPLGRDPNPGLRITALYGIYDVLWTVALILTSPWWVLRSLVHRPTWHMVRGRLTLTLRPLPAPGERIRVLVHGVSVGEIKASKSVVEGLCRTCEVVVSSSTNTGMEVARQLYPHLSVVRFPVDHMVSVSRFMTRVQPGCVVLMELEIWPNFLRRANRLGIPVAIVSGRITPASHASYKRFGTTLPQFNRITVFAVQDEDHASRFAELAGSRERVVVTGNVKVDGLRTGPVARDEAFRTMESLAGGRPGQAVLVAGSTHGTEDLQVYEAFHRADPEARIILVPRHPERGRSVAADLASRGLKAQLLTSLRASGVRADPSRPLIVDTIGELERIYGLADLVFVGGSLVPHGGQNMLEPAAQGKPVLHGPHVENFVQEAALLEQAGGSLRVGDKEELAAAVADLLADQPRRERMGAAGMEAVELQKGATARTLAVLTRRCGLER